MSKSTIVAYVCDANGTPWKAQVEVGSTLSDLMSAAAEHPFFQKGSGILGFEDPGLHTWTVLDCNAIGKWTGETPLKPRYKTWWTMACSCGVTGVYKSLRGLLCHVRKCVGHRGILHCGAKIRQEQKLWAFSGVPPVPNYNSVRSIGGNASSSIPKLQQ